MTDDSNLSEEAAIVHLPEKGQFYSEVHRVLRPQGLLVVGDWYRGREPFTPEMEQWVEDNGVTVAMETVEEAADRVAAAGFEQV